MHAATWGAHRQAHRFSTGERRRRSDADDEGLDKHGGRSVPQFLHVNTASAESAAEEPSGRSGRHVRPRKPRRGVGPCDGSRYSGQVPRSVTVPQFGIATQRCRKRAPGPVHACIAYERHRPDGVDRRPPDAASDGGHGAGIISVPSARAVPFTVGMPKEAGSQGVTMELGAGCSLSCSLSPADWTLMQELG